MLFSLKLTIIEQFVVLFLLLIQFGIILSNLGYFVLDNAPNNDTTLIELAKYIHFEPKERRLRYMGHILNLIAKAYLFGQDCTSFEDEYKQAGPP